MVPHPRYRPRLTGQDLRAAGPALRTTHQAMLSGDLGDQWRNPWRVAMVGPTQGPRTAPNGWEWLGQMTWSNNFVNLMVSYEKIIWWVNHYITFKILFELWSNGVCQPWWNTLRRVLKHKTPQYCESLLMMSILRHNQGSWSTCTLPLFTIKHDF